MCSRYFKIVLIALVLSAGVEFLGFAEEVNTPAIETRAHFRELAVRYGPPEKPEPRPFIGISMEVVSAGDVHKAGGPENCAGVRLTMVVRGKAAEKAGLKNGDIMFASKSNGEKKLFVPGDKDYNPLKEIIDLLVDKKPGDKITVCVLRDGKERDFTITLGERERLEMEGARHSELELGDRKPSRLEKFLEDNKLYDDYVKTAHMLYGASNSLQGSTRVVEDKPDFFRLTEITYLLRYPENTAPLADRIADSIEACFNEKKRDLPALISTAAKWLDEKPQGEVKLELKGDADDIARLEKFVLKLMELRAEALKELSEEEIKFAYESLPGIFGRGELNAEGFLKLLRIVAKVDFKKLFASCRAFAQLTSNENLALLKKAAVAHKDIDCESTLEGFEGDVLATLKTKIGNIVIGGEGPTVYRGDAAIIIDLGGDDYYAGAVAGSTLESPFSLCIDFAGDDVYACKEDLAQGMGILGAGILLDVEGDDTYRSSFFAQGCALLGAGVLADLAGDDTYRGSEFCQGVAMFGVAFVADSGGEDRYAADEFAQGVGLTKGFGAIIEVAGNDSYYACGKNPDFRDPKRSYVSMSQGLGFGLRPYGDNPIGTSGGIGLLADASGHDRYTSDYFGQGSSYWFALGILRDKQGCDNYFAGRYSQGAGIHLSLGALIDCEGDDSYIAYLGVSQGCGHDLAYGILEDRGGNDRYVAGMLSMGAGNDVGIGVLFDHGGNDYYAARDTSLGRGNYHKSRKAGSVGVFLDLGGKDRFIDDTDEPADGKSIARKDRRIGIFIDEP